MDQARISKDGPNRMVNPRMAKPNAQPKIKRFTTKGTRYKPRVQILRAYSTEATTDTKVKEMIPNTRLRMMNPKISSLGLTGEAKMFRMLRDHTSSRKATLTACCTLKKRSQKSKAPIKVTTKLILMSGLEMVLSHVVMNPQRKISTVAQ